MMRSVQTWVCIFLLTVVCLGACGGETKEPQLGAIKPDTAAMQNPKQILSGMGIPYGKEAFFRNLHNGKVVKLFLDAGMPRDTRDSRGWPAIAVAARGGNDEAVKLLLQAGADPDAYVNGRTPLMWAAESAEVAFSSRNYEQTIRNLIEGGANVDATFDGPRSAGRPGQTALMGAASDGFHGIVTVLLESGASARIASKDGWTALHEAAGDCNSEVQGFTRLNKARAVCAKIAQTLMGYGADTQAETNQGQVPLELAAVTGNEEIVKMLLQAGAEKNLERAAETARRYRHNRIYDLLNQKIIEQRSEYWRTND